MADVTIAELVANTFRSRAATVGLEWRDWELTFGEIDARANRMAGVLARRGLTRGDRLALYLGNCPEYIDLLLACTRLGVILVPINVLYREREAGHILQDAAPAAVVVADAPPAPGATGWPLDALRAEATAARADPPSTDPPAPDTPAALVYTSGTTGPAKGAVLTQANLAANARTLVDAWKIDADDRLLLPLPLFHVHGLGNGLHCWLTSGCRMRLLERFDRRTAADELLRFRPTLFFGVPTMYVRLLEVQPDTAAEIGRHLRLCVSGSAPLAPQVLEDFEARFGQRILERYGMTETLMTLSNPYEGERRAGTVGRPLSGVSVELRDEAGRSTPAGEVGELYVRSAMVCAGYWQRPDATAAAFAGGWFRTGDLAERSADGYYTLRGRRSDLIISGGFNIYPREIEEVLLEHEAVLEAAVVGAPDPLRGEVPVAFLVLQPDAALETETVLEHCRQRLASFKVPRRVRAVASLPRTALGKVQKGELK